MKTSPCPPGIHTQGTRSNGEALGGQMRGVASDHDQRAHVPWYMKAFLVCSLPAPAVFSTHPNLLCTTQCLQPLVRAHACAHPPLFLMCLNMPTLLRLNWLYPIPVAACTHCSGTGWVQVGAEPMRDVATKAACLAGDPRLLDLSTQPLDVCVLTT